LIQVQIFTNFNSFCFDDYLFFVALK